MPTRASLASALAGLVLAGATIAQAADRCLGVDPAASEPFHESAKTEMCAVHMSPTGYPLPDADCTPGARNPTLTVDILKTRGWTTKCVRDQASSAAAKRSLYAAYGIKPPSHNSGKTQTCELDHVVSLELGGADTLDNLWPECGPSGVALPKRWFKIKDAVENYLAREVKAGRISQDDAQRGIAEDWSRYIPAERRR